MMLACGKFNYAGNFFFFQPVLVSGVHKNMTSHLWTPEGFENEFGMERFFLIFVLTDPNIILYEI